ncbi:PIN domain-containing protein [Frankia sp. R82]|uniref:PIN domain-containing protein n=1 Tax=Frankia sp. R82 TaxID=2950553 RepID=UPI002044CCD3|nr:PIN domain-containing protein [Frankia sp. R82]MCM3883102.1 PIN domain-containing protein [Frankia sp. R82]
MDPAKPAEPIGGSFRSLFPGFYQLSTVEQAEILQSGLVVLDTNVLLDLYRYTKEARGELLGLLELFGDRLWIPYQVALEFHQNRMPVIGERMREPEGYIARLAKTHEGAVSCVGEFGRRFGVDSEDVERLLATLGQAYSSIDAHFRTIQSEYDLRLPEATSGDPVLDVLERLFDGHIGLRPSADSIAAAVQEAARRAKSRIPPGYKDFDGGKDGERASGDYLLWKEILDEAKKRKLPVILVTNDVKEDWITRHQGFTIGPRSELKEEMSDVAGVKFHIMNSRTLLRQGRDFLQVHVSDSTLLEAEESERQYKSRLAEAEMRASDARKMAEQAQMEAAVRRREAEDAISRHAAASAQLESLRLRQKGILRLVGRGSETGGVAEDELRLTREIGQIEQMIEALRAEIAVSQTRADAARMASREAEQAEARTQEDYYSAKAILEQRRSG